MLQTTEIGELASDKVAAVRVSRRYRGKLFQVTKAYSKVALVGMKIEDISSVLLLDIENEYRRGFSREWRAFNSYPSPDQVLEIKALIDAYVGLLPRNAELEAEDAAHVAKQREQDAELAKKQMAAAPRVVPETVMPGNAEW